MSYHASLMNYSLICSCRLEMARMPLQNLYDFRPLKTVELTPPDYRINPQHLIDSCVEKEVKVR